MSGERTRCILRTACGCERRMTFIDHGQDWLLLPLRSRRMPVVSMEPDFATPDSRSDVRDFKRDRVIRINDEWTAEAEPVWLFVERDR